MTNATGQSGCIFCEAVDNAEKPDSLVLSRGERNFILLNRFPYNNGHLMVAPYQHVSNPADIEPAAVEEMMRLIQQIIRVLREVYHPDGFNVGMNLGKTAGAGVEEHFHAHVVPRWNGDTNFMTAIAETRVIPEDFQVTLAKLKPYFNK